MTPSMFPTLRARAVLPPVLIMTDDKRLPDATDVARRIPDGWGLIFRHYGAANRAALATETVRLCQARGVIVLVAGDIALARHAEADGVHLPESILRSGRSLCSELAHFPIVTASAHGSDGLRRAAGIGADAALVSPVFATESHADAKPLGRQRFAALARRSRVPVYALGGISPANTRGLAELGACGIAGISMLKEI